MTETIKVEVDEELARRFRRKAMEKYGYKRGAVKKALQKLMEDYASRRSGESDWSAVRGAIKEDYKGMSSVVLQHSIWRIKNDHHSGH
jgi:hypothetical protein